MPSENYSFLLIEAYYAESPLIKGEAYNGNVLIDKASIIIRRTCTAKDRLVRQENRRAKAGTLYSTTVNARVGTFENTVRGITIKINPNQTVKSLVSALQKKFDEVNVFDDSVLSISVLIFSKEDRLDCKKLLKEAMKELKGTYKSYTSQFIVNN